MDSSLNFVLNRAYSDSKHTLASSEDINDLFLGVGGVDGLTVAEQRDIGKRLIGIHLLTKDFNR